MTIPTKIKIGSIVYEIETTDTPLIVDNKVCSGKVQYLYSKIQLSGEDMQGEQARNVTFWHEIVHAIVYDRGLDWGKDNELFTEELAKGLHSLMVDNSFLMPGQLIEGGQHEGRDGHD